MILKPASRTPLCASVFAECVDTAGLPTAVFQLIAGSAAEIDGSPCLTGDAVSLIEALGFRAPLDYGLDDDDRWLLGGLGDAFDVSLRS